MARLVPQSDGRLGSIVFIAQRAEAGGAEEKISPSRRLEIEPAGAQHPQEMPARKHEHITLDAAQASDDAVGARSDLVRRLASRTAVAEQLPVRMFRMNIDRPPAFILAIIPFDQIGVDFRHAAEAGQLARPLRTLQRAGKHLDESQPAQPLAESAGVALSTVGQWKVGPTGMLAGEAPRGLSVPRQINDRKQFAHAAARSQNGHCQLVISGGSTPNSW